MIKLFVLIFGIVQFIISAAEFIFPARAFNTWSSWSANRFFPLHGVLLIVGGLPLTIHRGYLSSVIFYIGLVVVLSGPFVLLYPEKVREAFSYSSEEFNGNSLKKIIRFDALLRLATSVILALSYYKS